MSESTRLSGVFAPVLTPMREDLSPDPDRFLAHCRWLLADGCHGLAVFGTTSEANSLSVDERVELLEGLVAAGIAPEKLVVGTGMCAMPDTVRLTRHAVGLGCAGVLMLPPFYYKGVSDDGLFAAYAEVIERVADGRLRIYLYHIPKLTSVPITPGLIGRLLESYEAQVLGIKDSSGDWSNTQALLRDFPGFATFTGTEETMLATLRAGGAGCISAVANVNAAAIRGLYDNWRTPHADALQERLTTVRHVVQAKPLIPALKSIVARHRGDDGWLNLRPPLVALDDAETRALFAGLDAAQFSMAASPAAA